MLRKLYSKIKFTVKLSVVFSLVCSLSLASLTHATSPADDDIHILDSLYVGGAGDSCNQQNRTISWSDQDWWKTAWNYQNNYDNARAHTDAFIEEFNANQEAGSGWAVSRNPNANTGSMNMITIQTFSPSATLTVLDGGRLHVSGIVRSLDIFLNPGSGCRVQNWNTGATTVSAYGNSIVGQNGYLLVASDNIVYPTGYEGEQIPTSPPPSRNYVALGDSFSSGEGNPPFEVGTEDTCHRSSSAFPRLLTSSFHISLTDFVACAGAITSDVDGVGSEDQITALSQDTDLVTVTIGGNDVGFKDYATTCTITVCDFSTQAYQDIHNNMSNDLPGKLADVYEAIDAATSNDAKIYVMGYPHLAPSEMPTGASSMCFPLNGGNNNPDPTQNNGAAIYAIQTQLNNTIAQAVADYGSSKFQYVNPNEIDSPFIGHDWCSQDRYFTQITINQISHSYHPNGPGHAAYATIMRDAID